MSDDLLDHDLNILVAKIGSIYTKARLSPPFHLRDRVRRWRDIPEADLLRAIHDHFKNRRFLYSNGAGEQHLALLESDIRRACKTQSLDKPKPEVKPKQKLKPKRDVPSVRQVEGRRSLTGLFDDAIEEPSDDWKTNVRGEPLWEDGVPIDHDDDA